MREVGWFLKGVFAFSEREISIEGEFVPPLTVYVGPNGGGKTLFLATLSLMSSVITNEKKLAIISGTSLTGAFSAFAGKMVVEEFNAYLIILFKDKNWERYKEAITKGVPEVADFDEIIREQMMKTPLNHYNIINIVKNKGKVNVGKVFSYHPGDVKEYKENYRSLSDGEAAKALLQSLLENSEKGDLLILDMPESFLDPKSFDEITSLIKEKVKGKVAMAISTHSLEFLTKLAIKVKDIGYVIRIEDGRALERWKVKSVLKERDVRVKKTLN